MTHANAPLTPLSPASAREVDRSSKVGRFVRAAERFQCSPATASKWAARYRAGLPMTDRVVASSPNARLRCPRRLEQRIVETAVTAERWGPHRIAYHLGSSALDRRPCPGPLPACPLLVHLDQATGLPVRKPKRSVPGVHTGRAGACDVKTGASPTGVVARPGAIRAAASGAARDRAAAPPLTWLRLHHAIDDFAVCLLRAPTSKQTAAAFWDGLVLRRRRIRYRGHDRQRFLLPVPRLRRAWQE